MMNNDKLEMIKETLDKIDAEVNIDINIPSLIEKAELIKKKKQTLRKDILFGISSMVVLIFYSFVISYYGIKIFIIFLLLMLCLLPWVIIPFSLNVRRET